MLKNFVFLVLTALIIRISAYFYFENVRKNQDIDGLIVVKQFNGAGMLIAECGDKVN